jgi:hypothetical protein
MQVRREARVALPEKQHAAQLQAQRQAYASVPEEVRQAQVAQRRLAAQFRLADGCYSGARPP